MASLTDHLPTAAAPSVGSTLAAARGTAGLTVTEVAERTRIRAGIIRDIERDEFATCGGTFYARGHVRSLASTLGVDPAAVLAQFDRTHDSAAPRLVTETLPDYPPSEAPAASQTGGPRWVSLMIGVATLVVVVIVVSVVVGMIRRPGSRVQVAVPPATPTVVPSAGASARPSAAPVASPLTLRLTVAGTPAWVRVTASGGTQLFQGVLQPGDAKAFRDARALTVRYGNPAAVRVHLNGTALGRPTCTQHGVCTMVYPAHGTPSPSPR